MITPAQKISLLRSYEANPASAVLMLADMLRAEMKTHMEEMMPKVLADLKKEMPDLEKVMLALKGADGEDADAEEVAQTLIEMPEFIDMTKGEKGDSVKGDKGDKGNDYVLTNSDKNEIAGKIKVPIVKEQPIVTQVIKEQPIVTQVIKEKAVTDKPLEIASKLNTLEEKVDMSVIRGLRKLLTDIRGSVRLGGGKSTRGSGSGMGNWVHQQFSVSSATTTVTLNSKPAAGGTAILVRYQGQLLAHDVQYSISGKTVTLLFTPEDSTFVDTTYVRS